MSDAVLSLQEASDLAGTLREKVAAAVFGQEELITETLCCLLAGGHILMTGAPGLAKTTLVRVFARYLGLDFGRVQFTPDLLPSDIVGADVLNVEPNSGKRIFEFSSGPVFTTLLLADEINRASPRTQSALLEAMQERSVTVGGKNHVLPKPFMVFATQNPFESEGTFPLPEAQLDRFLMHTLVDYPDEQAEERILREHAVSRLVGENFGVIAGDDGRLDREKIQAVIATVAKVRVEDEILAGINELVRSSRPQSETCPENMRHVVWYGAGPRAGISLISVCKALALMERSEQVRWSHVRRLAKPVLRHRMRLTAQASRDSMSEDEFIELLLSRLEAKHKNLAAGVA